MTDFKVKCYNINKTGDAIGAEIVTGENLDVEVRIYNGDDVETILITDETEIEALKARLENLDSTYITQTELRDILVNSLKNTTINATTLNGLASDKFMKVDQAKTYTFNPSSHASNTAEYGLGSDSNYGHVKIVDNLNSASFRNGEALSAHQGKVLSDRMDSIRESADELMEEYYKNSLRVNIYRSDDPKNTSETKSIIDCTRGYHNVYAKITCDDPSFNLADRTVIMVLNGVPYTKTTDSNGVSGKLNITSNLPVGVYVMQVFVRGSSRVRSCSDMKILNVT